MTPFQVLTWLSHKNATFYSKNGDFTVEAQGLYYQYKVPVEEQLNMTPEKLVEYLSTACQTLTRAIEGPPKEQENGVESTNVS